MNHSFLRIFLAAFFLMANIAIIKAQDTLSPIQFQQAIYNTPNAVLIDVRTPKEFNEGHLENALNINWQDSSFISKMDSIDHNKPIYLYCLGGGRSAAAAKKLKEKGFTQIQQLSGGYLAWQNNKLPIQKFSIEKKDIYSMEDLQLVLRAHERVLVDFGAIWCGPCLLMSPKIKKIEKEFAEKIFIQKINVDDAKELTQSMNIRSIPILILFEKGKPIKALEGNQSINSIRKFLQ